MDDVSSGTPNVGGEQIRFKRDRVPPEMRARLMRNREGRLLPDQWVDLATEPLVILLLLLAPALLILGARGVALLRLGWWLPLILVLIVVVPVVIRAIRYARAPIYFLRLRVAPEEAGHGWRLWRPIEFMTHDDTRIRFTRRLAPRLPVHDAGEYLVYYLEDGSGRTLLSYAPANHEHAELWQPGDAFARRHAQRTGKPVDSSITG
jgi:hypothetical protein